MSPQDPPGTSTKKERREEARERARAMREDAERTARRRRTLVVAVAAALVVGLVVGAGALVQSLRSQAARDAAAPTGTSEHGGLLVGADDAPVVVTQYVDFLCPACRQFEDENASVLDHLRAQGEIAVEYVPVAILDRYSQGTRYSTRSAGAAYCAVEHDPQVLPDLTAALFAAQPAEGTPGLDDDELARLAAGAGAGEATQACVADGTFTGYAAAVTDRASQDGLQGTPTIRVDGVDLEDRSSAGLRAAVDAAREESTR
jgi:protein-disulfide isomerase